MRESCEKHQKQESACLLSRRPLTVDQRALPTNFNELTRFGTGYHRFA